MQIDDTAGGLARRLQLERPLAIMDIESTGTAVELDRIVELAILTLHPDGRLEEHQERFHPGIPIPEEASAIHGISDADVAHMPRFEKRAGAIAKGLAGCDIAGHNARGFDVRMLASEMKRAGVTWEPGRIVDTLAIFRKLEPHNLNAAVARWVSPMAADVHAEEAHGALADARAALDVLAGQLERRPELPCTVEELAAWSHEGRPGAVDADGTFVWRYREPALAFGKHAGRQLRELVREEPSYLKWMLAQDFSDEVKKLVREAQAGRFPTPPAPAAAPAGGAA